MVREIKEVLDLLGWGDGFKLPIANDLNKELEQTVEDLLKKKAELIVKHEIINEKRETMKKNLKGALAEQENNQKILNRLSQQLEANIQSLKNSEATQEQRNAEMKEIKKSLSQMENSIEKLRADITINTNKMNALKESLQWGEDALFAWEEQVMKGEKENEILEKFKIEDEERFQKLDLERKIIEEGLFESKVLEKKESDRQRALKHQLENLSKLYKQAYNERDRLMRVWHDAVNLSHNREEENKRLIKELCNIRNKARSKCSELYEEKNFDEELLKTNNSMKGELMRYQNQTQKIKEFTAEIEDSIKHLTLEKELKNKTSGHISGNIESERRKNIELQTKNKARILKYNKLIEAITNLQQQCEILKVDTMTNEQKYRNAHDMYEMSCKASDEETRETERLHVFAVQLKQEINTFKEQQIVKEKQLKLMKKLQNNLSANLKTIQSDLEEVDTQLSLGMAEEAVLSQQITELKDRCSGKEEKEEMEAEIKELEPLDKTLTKENIIIRKHLKDLKKEYKDKLTELKNGEHEIEQLTDFHKNQRMQLNAQRKCLDEIKEELQKEQLQLNLLLMRENYIKESMTKHDNAVCKLERERLILEAAMNERKMEIEVQKETLTAKKRSLLEEKAMLGRTIDHLNMRIKQNQTKYFLSLDLLEKDESGKQLSIAYFKIKLAQEKYDLQREGDDLEAKINKTEKEILALENTLKLLGAANENYKTSLESGNKDDPEVVEKDNMERKYTELKKMYQEDNGILDSVRNEIQMLMNDISKVKVIAKQLEDDWKIKEKEVTALEKDLANKQQKLTRATTVLIKLTKEIRKNREPTQHRQLAQRDIDVKIQQERNKSVLQQLLELTFNYVETKPLVSRYLNEYGLRLPTKFAGCRSVASSYGIDSARSKVSARSDSSAPCVVNLDPEELLGNEPVSKNKIIYNKYLY